MAVQNQGEMGDSEEIGSESNAVPNGYNNMRPVCKQDEDIPSFRLKFVHSTYQSLQTAERSWSTKNKTLSNEN